MRPVEAPEFRTARLRLLPFRPGDAPHVLAYAADPRVFRFLPVRQPQPYTLADAAAHLEELLGYARAGFPSWRIVAPDAGTIGAIRFRPADGCAELGYALAPEAWGKGYASEACAAVVAWARPRLEPLVARCHPGNAASLRVLEKLGFLQEGLDRDGRRFLRLPPLSATPASR